VTGFSNVEEEQAGGTKASLLIPNQSVYHLLIKMIILDRLIFVGRSLSRKRRQVRESGCSMGSKSLYLKDIQSTEFDNIRRPRWLSTGTYTLVRTQRLRDLWPSTY
jgi:hypothetical protein